MNGDSKVVCVTGASGFLASWLVKFLLHRGYTIKASVRDPGDVNKIGHLLRLNGAKERLHLFKADLLEEGSFDTIIEGCEGVFHTASPCILDAQDPQAEIIDPAVKGTLNVLTSCAKVSSLKRVILTSSIASMVYNTRPQTPDVIVDETWYSDTEYCKEMKKLWYQLSKALAEDAAWKFTKKAGIDMVCINPTMVIGPLLQPTLNLSSSFVLNLINGSETFQNLVFGWVNVKDVAEAHILAYETISARGRYCLVERLAHISELLTILHKLYPDIKLPAKCEDDKPFMQTYQLSKEKVQRLGMTSFIPLETSLKETVESFKEKNLVTIKNQRQMLVFRS